MALAARAHFGIRTRGRLRVLTGGGGGSGGYPSRAPGSPLPNGVVGMAVFLGTETMLFAGLVSAYLILRAGSLAWPPPDQPRLPVGVTAVNTLFLLASAWTMQRAFRAIRRPHLFSEPLRWVAATAALGAVFLAVQGYEWIRLLRYGLRMSSSLYGAAFYTVVGAHGLHVLAAVVALVAVAIAGVLRPRTLAPRLEALRLYWFFVVGVWPVLYVLVYLI